MLLERGGGIEPRAQKKNNKEKKRMQTQKVKWRLLLIGRSAAPPPPHCADAVTSSLEDPRKKKREEKIRQDLTGIGPWCDSISASSVRGRWNVIGRLGASALIGRESSESGQTFADVVLFVCLFVLQRHHFAQTMCILNTEGCNIFEHLSSQDYTRCLDLLQEIILGKVKQQQHQQQQQQQQQQPMAMPRVVLSQQRRTWRTT